MPNQRPASSVRALVAGVMGRRYFWEALTALVFLALGCVFGGARHGRVVLRGATGMGTVVDYETAKYRTRPGERASTTHSGYMPVVEFEAEGRSVRFTNWWGTKVAPQKGERVRVLYDPADPSIAMIDQRIRNWMPWAPLLAAGTFLALVALRTWGKSRTS